MITQPWRNRNSAEIAEGKLPVSTPKKISPSGSSAGEPPAPLFSRRIASAMPFLLLCILALPLAAQNVLLDQRYNAERETSIRVPALASQLPTSGYLPVRVEIQNDEKSDLTWDLNTKSSIQDYTNSGGSELNSSHRLACPAGETRSFGLSLPLLTDFPSITSGSYNMPSTLNLTVNPGGNLPTSEAYLSTQHLADWPSVLISEKLYLPQKIKLDKLVNPGGSRSGTEFGAAFDPKKMSADWHAYLGYQAILMSSADWLELNPDVRRAILASLRFGNDLTIYHQGQDPTWSSLQLPQAIGENQPHGMGSITLAPYTTEKAFVPDEIVTRLRKQYRRDNLLAQSGSDYLANTTLRQLLGKKDFNIALVVIVLLIFGIVVGPINLFVFTKGGQRHKLFFTTPLISLAASLVLLLVIVFQDGFGGSGHRAVLMQVHPGENTAYLSQEQVARTGLLFNTAFDTAPGTWISPMMMPASRWTRVNSANNGGGNSYQVSEKEEKTEYRGDWFQSRSELAHLLLATRPTRGRIELASPARKGNAPVIRSTFDFPLDRLFYRDKSGGIWFAENVSNAAPVTLKKAGEKDWIDMLQTNADQFGTRLSQKVHELCKAREIFMARAENGPAIDNFDAIEWRSSRTVLTGPIFQP